MSSEIAKIAIDQEESKACFNCKKMIELPKIRIHEASCRRNTVKCGKCQEMIPRCTQDQHDFEFHEIIQCEYCMDFDCERFMMKDHHDYCYMKPIQCKYCELMISQEGDGVEKHLAYCGSKTRECEICGTSIQQKELKAHMDSGICEFVLEDKREAQKQKVSQDLERFRQQDQARIAQQTTAATGKFIQKQSGAVSSQKSSNSNGKVQAGQKRAASKAIPTEEIEDAETDTPTRKVLDENKTKINKMLNMNIKAEQKKEQDSRKREVKQQEKKVQKKFFM